MSADFINGAFEALGACFLFLNVLKLWQDKEIKGIDWKAVAFFFTWGLWNLWFYPAQGLVWSFLGGVLICLMNSLWLGLVCYYWLARRKADVSLRPIPVTETVTQ